MIKNLIYSLIVLQLSLFSCELTMSNPDISSEQFEGFKSDIIHDPAKLGRYYMIFRSLEKDTQVPLQYGDIEDSRNKHYPLSYLVDCFDKTCPLARMFSPRGEKNRALYEQVVARALVKTYNKTTRPHFVDIGPGGLLSTARILTLAHKRGLQEVNISLVDPVNQPIVDLFKDCNIQRFNITSPSCTQMANFHKAFLAYTTKLFQQNNITVKFYTPDTFAQATKAKKITIDLVTACDTPPVTFAEIRGYLESSATAHIKAFFLAKGLNNDALTSIEPSRDNSPLLSLECFEKSFQTLNNTDVCVTTYNLK